MRLILSTTAIWILGYPWLAVAWFNFYDWAYTAWYVEPEKQRRYFERRWKRLTRGSMWRID